MTNRKKMFWGFILLLLNSISAKEGISPTLNNISYGKDPSQTLNFWKAPSNKPTPVLFHIHGGAWLGGEKDKLLSNDFWLSKGISVVSIDYRFSSTAILPAPLHDAARALQSGMSFDNRNDFLLKNLITNKSKGVQQ
ncbi:alpha/beta hydrolase [Lentisphaera profundi]|uniref:Alpha/beta hydrolase n=1 Tax=Lentisphaera profundi TaxID=1658616 RepID=A0ABY7VQQ5_9BACT|nr:alpha/beta hydrolase [Lentisphaera profundi]WDE95217.1 alpha/beta hydrolase [Lentisphaera profundi]